MPHTPYLRRPKNNMTGIANTIFPKRMELFALAQRSLYLQDRILKYRMDKKQILNRNPAAAMPHKLFGCQGKNISGHYYTMNQMNISRRCRMKPE